MKNTFSWFILLVWIFAGGCSQAQAPPHVSVRNQAFDEELESLLSFSIPVMDVEELSQKKEAYLVLDAREREEFDVAHIPDARFLGYKNPNFEMLAELPKAQPILLYCSVGYRSEKLGEKLRMRGFTNITNLYGSIFEWANAGLPLVDKNGNPTRKIHTYNRRWSKWVEDGAGVERVW